MWDGAIGCLISMNMGSRLYCLSSYDPEAETGLGEGLWQWSPPCLDTFKFVISVAAEMVVNGSSGLRQLLCNKVGHLPASAAAPFLCLDFRLQGPC